jgi:hypothetical protein
VARETRVIPPTERRFLYILNVRLERIVSGGPTIL